VAAGALEAETQSVFGVFSRSRYLLSRRAVASMDDASARVRAAVSGAEVSPHTAAYCALISALHWEKRLFPELSSNEAHGKLRGFAEKHWASDAANHAVNEISAAVFVAVAVH
jgi:hypothetical protein